MSLASVGPSAIGRNPRLLAEPRSPSLLVDRRHSRSHLILPAAAASAEAVSTIVRYGSGLLYVMLPDYVADRLDLPAMVAGGRRILGGAPAVAVDAADGVSTGISAADRAHTVRTLADPTSRPDDLNRPGHILPIRLSRPRLFGRPSPGHAALGLAKQFGLPPVVVMTEVVSEADPRRMADCDEAARLAQRLGLRVVSA